MSDLRARLEAWLSTQVDSLGGQFHLVRVSDIRALLAEPAAEDECHCPPCPGRGNDGHGLTHCAECCFGSGVDAEFGCPKHNPAAAADGGEVEAHLRTLHTGPHWCVTDHAVHYFDGTDADPCITARLLADRPTDGDEAREAGGRG